jgi:hypothetical protein
MRADTKKKHEMGKRFAILTGAAAVGVMALGAQTGAAASEGVVEYGTKLTIYKEQGLLHGEVKSKIRPCWEGREVILFKKRPGPDRKLGATRSGPQQAPSHNWYVGVKALVGKGNSLLGRVHAKVSPKVGDGFVCRADRSRTIKNGDLCFEHPSFCSTDVEETPRSTNQVGVMALGAQTGAAASEGVSYDTKLTIRWASGSLLWGEVNSKVRKCTEGREVILFRKRPGPDRKLGATTSGPQWESHNWRVSVKGLKTSGSPVGRVYAKATPKVGDGFKCSPGYSRVVVDCPCHPEKKSTDPPARTRLRAQTALAGGESVDSTPPDLQLSGPKKQNPQNDGPMCDRTWCDVIVQVSCGDEACTVRATGKLTNVKMDRLDPDGPWDVAPGKTFGGTGPEMGKGKQRKQVRQALGNGENVQAKISVKATDAAGNVATAKRTITLVK